jgi:hypothetical protein
VENPSTIKSAIVFYITPTEILFLAIAGVFLIDEVVFHAPLLDVLFHGGLWCATLEAPAMILIVFRMSQRVGYTAKEKSGMSISRLRFVNELERAFPAGRTALDSATCTILVLGVMWIGNVLALQILPIETAGYFINQAITENLAYQVGPIIGLTAMLLYPRRAAGIPAAIGYILSFALASIDADPIRKFAFNLIPIAIFALFFGLARRDVPAPSKPFNYAMGFTSAMLFFIAHYNRYGTRLVTWIAVFIAGLGMAFYYIKSRNIAVTMWGHVLLNILALKGLTLVTLLLTMVK